MSICDCCYCKTLNPAKNGDYLNGLKRSIEIIEKLYHEEKEIFDSHKIDFDAGRYKDKVFMNLTYPIRVYMRILGKIHNEIKEEADTFF